jgi:hypothetical protein
MKTIEQLIEQALAVAGTPADGVAANLLLREFHKGAPLEKLSPLLLSPEPRVAQLGAWIAQELGEMGKPLLAVVSQLLGHPDRDVRFWLIDCVLLWAGPSEPRVISDVVQLAGDPDRAVRLQALQFLARASREQLESALAFLEGKGRVSDDRAALAWMLSPLGREAEEVGRALGSPDSYTRRYAAAAAARMSGEDRGPLTLAASSDDPEVQRFATSYLAWLQA